MGRIERVCSGQRCPRPDAIQRVTRGLCGTCYSRWYRSGSPVQTSAAADQRREYDRLGYSKQERMRDGDLRRKFGMTLEEYRSLPQECAICRTTDPGGHGGFHVDHCHQTGRVRGLLCYRHNVGLGFFDESVESLLAAAEYLEIHMP